MNNLSTETWCFDVGLACWDFQLGSFNGSTQALLKQGIGDVLSVVDPFATVSSISLTTGSDGEDAEELDSERLDQLDRVLANHDDIEEVEISLDLKCSGVNGVEELVRESATLWFQLEHDGDRDSPLRLLFSLDVDLYFPKTLGENTDNKEMCHLNFSKLNTFLDKIKSEAKGKLMNIDAPNYLALLDEEGHIVA